LFAAATIQIISLLMLHSNIFGVVVSSVNFTHKNWYRLLYSTDLSHASFDLVPIHFIFSFAEFLATTSLSQYNKMSEIETMSNARNNTQINTNRIKSEMKL